MTTKQSMYLSRLLHGHQYLLPFKMEPKTINGQIITVNTTLSAFERWADGLTNTQASELISMVIHWDGGEQEDEDEKNRLKSFLTALGYV